MAPDEVETHIAALCKNESGVLHHIYGGADLAALAGGSSSSSGGSSSSSVLHKAAQEQSGRLYKAFFLRALAVTPNRWAARRGPEGQRGGPEPCACQNPVPARTLCLPVLSSLYDIKAGCIRCIWLQEPLMC
jgi:hypothetical protein